VSSSSFLVHLWRPSLSTRRPAPPSHLHSHELSPVQLIKQADTQRAAGEPTQLVVDGKTLTHILGDKPAEAQLAKLGSMCTAVVICRASPSQKANIVTMMRTHELHIAQRGRDSGLGRWMAQLNRNLGVRLPLAILHC
jgi:hypothetical protein